MFARRHPYLFFLLIFTLIVSVTLVALTTLIVAATGGDALDSQLTGDSNKIGVVEIKGGIIEAELIIENIKRFREADTVKAILLRIDTPGGAVGPSQEIYRELRKTAAEKKIIASMGTVAASGGYYVAAGAHGIMANPGTITGSIGVVMGYTNFEALLRKIGLTPVVVKSGEFKDMGSPLRPMEEAERELLESFILGIHRQFVEAVAEGRNMPVSQVEPLADGRIFSGEEARKHGLIDRLGNFQDAVAWAAELGGVEGTPDLVYGPEEAFSFLDFLTETAINSIVEKTLDLSFFTGYLLQMPNH
jgi:protease-4